MAEGDDESRVTFRIDTEKKERLEDLINFHNALADDDERLTKSDLLRGCVDDLIADLESDLQEEVDALEEFLEGNPNPATATAD
ncbi:hypothetical protein [Haloarcula amylovorans]|uniref:hypothetical protein n=1 Tax=Haloarcula amylovorans TaxID=2562280 RepID=UPI0010769E1F|nr:hypothetical protein [Halomicroarcula amylolytica]